MQEVVPLTYTTKQLAKMLSCDSKTIQRSTLIPGRLVINRNKKQTVRFSRAAVDQWLRENERKRAVPETA